MLPRRYPDLILPITQLLPSCPSAGSIHIQDLSESIFGTESALPVSFRAPRTGLVARLRDALQVSLAAARAALAGSHRVGTDMLAGSAVPHGVYGMFEGFVYDGRSMMCYGGRSVRRGRFRSGTAFGIWMRGSRCWIGLSREVLPMSSRGSNSVRVNDLANMEESLHALVLKNILD